MYKYMWMLAEINIYEYMNTHAIGKSIWSVSPLSENMCQDTAKIRWYSNIFACGISLKPFPAC